MEKSQNTVDYKPLPLDGSEIRLVAIIPGEKDAAVECVISQYPFSENGVDVQEYEALSYVWGEAAVTIPITVNNKPFQATKNLEAALRALRRRDAERLLWIDAICINQASVAERNREVRRMDQVYRNAVQVVIWLGDGTEPGNIPVPQEDIDRTQIPDETYELMGFLANADEEEAGDAENLLIQTGNAVRGLKLLTIFFSRHWFTRVWILQEISVSKTATVLYGDKMIPWRWVVGVVDRLNTNKSFMQICAAVRAEKIQLCRVRTIRHRQNEDAALLPFHLLDLLIQTRFFEVTDPRDRLYGLLGMVNERLRDEKLLEVDYAKPVAEVFLGLSVFMLQKGMLSQSLCAVTSPVEGLPSWATDWTASLDDQSTSGGPSASRLSSGIERYMQYYAIMDTEPPSNPPRFSPDLRQVTLRGRVIDAYGIWHMAKRFDDGPSRVEEIGLHMIQLYRERLIQWEDDMERQPCSREKYTTQAERRQKWKEAILHEMPGDQTKLGACYDVLTDREQELSLSTEASLDALAELLGHFGMNMEYRRPFVTMLGIMGSAGASDMRHEDVTCVFVGSRVPYVLRPVNGSLGSSLQCQFVGCCWAGGLVDIEAADGERLGLWELQDITLV
jgi:hypothetical protein